MPPVEFMAVRNFGLRQTHLADYIMINHDIITLYTIHWGGILRESKH